MAILEISTIRLGKDSLAEIQRILASGSGELTFEISINCRQVPEKINNGVWCFIWLGSDNNKGQPTSWKQGVRAIGQVVEKIGGPRYSDLWEINILIKYIFEDTLTHRDIVKIAGSKFERIMDLPVLGMQTYSNQTIQLWDQAKVDIQLPVILEIIQAKEPQFNSYLEKNPFGKVYNNLHLAEVNLEAFIQDKSDDGGAVEDEDLGDSRVSFKRLDFDPKTISVDFRQITLQSIIDRLDYGEISFDTEYQRNFIWKIEKQGLLIESILLRLPLPTFYFDAQDDNKWEVVDGLQRLTTIDSFVVKNVLTLQGLEFLTEFNGLKFGDLPREYQRGLRNFEISIAVIKKGTPSAVKYQIFKRVNQGGEKLNPQEMRHALNPGIPSMLIKQLADSDGFKLVTGGKVSSRRMLDREFILRALAFYLISPSDYEPDMDSFLSSGMEMIRKLSDGGRERLILDFSEAIDLAWYLFGENAFRKDYDSGSKRRKPINKALFEVVISSFSRQDRFVRDIIRKQKVQFLTSFAKLMKDPNFLISISQGTGSKLSVETRHFGMQKLIQEVKNDFKN